MFEWPRSAEAWQALFEGCTVVLAIVAAFIAWFQLSHIGRPIQLEALKTLYQYFDDKEQRNLRRQIHGAIPKFDMPPDEPINIIHLGKDNLQAIEQVATSLDAAAIIVNAGLVDKELVFRRFIEVIIPVYWKIGPYLDVIREKKGIGWQELDGMYRSAVRYWRDCDQIPSEFRTFDIDSLFNRPDDQNPVGTSESFSLKEVCCTQTT